MYQYIARILRWIDGDTLLLEIDVGFFITRTERIRLARINAPELTSEVPYQRRKARHARAVGKKRFPSGTKVVVHTSKNKRDMYARYIGEVFHEKVNVSDYLLEKGAVKMFEG